MPMMSRYSKILPRCTNTETGTLWSDLRTPDTVCSCRFNLTGFPLECTSGNLCQQYHTNKARLISMYRMRLRYTLFRRKTFRKIYGLCGKIPERLRILKHKNTRLFSDVTANTNTNIDTDRKYIAHRRKNKIKTSI